MITQIKAILITLLITFILATISVYLIESYGWTLFIFIPFIIGYLPAYILGKGKKLERKQAFSISFLTLLISCLGLLIFAMEGLICIAMALPVLILLVYAGAYIAYENNRNAFLKSNHISLIIVSLSFSCLSFDSINDSNNLTPVKTKIIVNAPINSVWTNVITFDKIDQPLHWIFKTGISYPTDATIVGNGVGAIRYCNFTTGSFIEPITTWDEPNLLQFDVKDQPIPMNELNPFWEIQPPHLDGYFKSYKGQFKLKSLANNKTEVEGTTWYKVELYPQFYWKSWSEYIIHNIHNRVLFHIKSKSELHLK